MANDGLYCFYFLFFFGGGGAVGLHLRVVLVGILISICVQSSFIL